MFEQFNQQFVSLNKQMAEAAIKANSLALENVERLVGLQLKTVESRLAATMAFAGEAAEVRDLESARAIWPKGVQLMKESAEQFYGASQEAFGQSLKTSEAIGELVKGSFEAAGATVGKAAGAKASAKK